MGTIFDSHMAHAYESWYRSSAGQAIDRALEHVTPTLLHANPGDRILDIGCGSGNHLIVFSKLRLNVNGVDASPYMISKARQRLGERCTLRTGMAEDLPFDDNEFDFAALINTLEFLEDPLGALREAGRVARKRVFIGVINSLSWEGFSKKVQGYFGDLLFSRARFYSLWRLKSLVREAYGHVPVSWGCLRLNHRPAQRPDRLSRSPFGSFLAISATMTHKTITCNLPLRLRIKRAGAPLVGDLPRSAAIRALPSPPDPVRIRPPYGGLSKVLLMVGPR
jgi:ubiquinone/menaquinone biosynthesis C-methylase UbiE